MSLEGYIEIEPAVSLADIRTKEAKIMLVRDRLAAVRGSALRFPFVRYGNQGLRAFQAYLVEFPTEVAALFPGLTRAMKRLDVPVAVTPGIANLGEASASRRAEVGTTYRAADENASASKRDPFSIDPALVERGCRGHAVTQNALAAFLRLRGIEPMSPSSPQINFGVHLKGVAPIMTRVNQLAMRSLLRCAAPWFQFLRAIEVLATSRARNGTVSSQPSPRLF